MNTEEQQPGRSSPRGNTTNFLHGNAGSVVQARDIYGGVHFTHQVDQVPLMSVVPEPPNEIVPRPKLLDNAVTELLRDGQQGVVALAGLTGAGGFGKTTLASMIANDKRVRERFGDGIAWVTLGEQLNGVELAGKINDLCFRVSGTKPSFNDPNDAGLLLGEALANKQCLLIVDDVWFAHQLAPFLQGGPSCRRLVTTRNRDALPITAKTVSVDAMNNGEARRLLSEGLPHTTDDVWEPLLARTGKWPVLLNLANRAVHRSVRSGLSVAEAVRVVDGWLAADGPTALDYRRSDQRNQAVKATVEVSLSLIDNELRDRFLELAVFPEDATIPQHTLQIYWGHTAGMKPHHVTQLCLELNDLSLVQGYESGENARLWLHDVIGAYLRTSAPGRCCNDQVPNYHQALLDAFRKRLPSDHSATSWWELPDDEPYLWRHLVYHLHQAGHQNELDSLVSDFRWIYAVLHRHSQVEVERDLAYSSSSLAHTLRQAIAQSPNVLMPLKPHNALASTLLSSLRRYPALADYVAAAAQTLTPPYLLPTNPLPEPPHPAQRRVITSRFASVSSLAISPDGTWLATGTNDGTVELWNTDGTPRTTINAHNHPVSSLAISPDGTWLATASEDSTVRLWNTDGTRQTTISADFLSVSSLAISPDSTWLATGTNDGTVELWNTDGTPRTTIEPHNDRVTAVVTSRDGTWLATASEDGTVELWNTDGTPRTTIKANNEPVSSLAISPDGRWLAIGGRDYTVRLWNTDGTLRTTLDAHNGPVSSLAISPDGSWLATASEDGTVELWNANGTPQISLDAHTGCVTAVAISPDGTWLATASEDSTVRLWNTKSRSRTILDGHTDWVTAVAISPDGTWLATASEDSTVRVWNTDGTLRTAINTEEFYFVTRLAISPDGTWLAAGSLEGTIELWNTDGTLQTALGAYSAPVNSLAISPDGAWLATARENGTVELWNTDGTLRTTIKGHTEAVTAVAISPDGTWLATASKDRTVRLWKTNGRPRSNLGTHTDWVTAVAISPDGTCIATASNDGWIRLWNSRRSKEMTALRTEIVGPVAWFPDSLKFAVCGPRRPFGFRLIR